MAKKQGSRFKEEKTDTLKLSGVVDEVLPGTLFRVKCETGADVLATLAGKLREGKIRILLGDRVDVAVSVYDLTHGRITWRH
jgi:translation initiation factor IF-1